MNEATAPAQWDTGFDRVLSFTVPGRNARGRLVRLGPVLDTILSAHAYPDPARHLLAEALVITALMGSLLKEAGSQLTMQAQGEGGPVSMMVSDYRQGELRGYVQHSADGMAGLGASPGLPALFGEGYLAITFDLAAEGQRYQASSRLKTLLCRKPARPISNDRSKSRRSCVSVCVARAGDA